MNLLNKCSQMLRDLYYPLKPIIPRRLQIELRKQYAAWQMSRNGENWPIDEMAGRKPRNWKGWPGGKQFALVLTHDVERAEGQARCRDLMNMEKSLGFRSAFNFVAEDYETDQELRRDLIENGFEIGLHGVNHGGNIFRSDEVFRREAARINRYLKEWNCSGFRSPRMYHDLKRAHGLNVKYDSSTFDTDIFEPQPDGMRTIFPFFVPNGSNGDGYVELPYTLPQDFTVFILLGHKDLSLWKQKLRWIADRGGMAMLITHPDYMAFNGDRPRYDEYPADLYREFLDYIRTVYEDQYWQALPREVAEFSRKVHEYSKASPGAAGAFRSEQATPREAAVTEKVRKACLIYYYRFKGSAMLYREAKALKDRGYEVDVICLRDSDEQPVVQEYEGLNLYCIQSRPAQREKSAVSYFKSLITFCIKSAAVTSWLGLKKRYDFVYVTTPPDVLVFSGLIPKLLGAKVILDIHDIGPELFMRKLHTSEDCLIIKTLKWLERMSTRFSDHVITVTDIWKDKLIDRAVPAYKCTSILNVPDDNLFKPYPEWEKRPSDKIRLSYHGSLEEHFGVDLLLDAMPEVKLQVPNVELVIYGAGRLKDLCEDKIEIFGMKDFVHINDFVPFYKLPSILNEATIGIVPTKAALFSGEALSMKALEYMALGIPIVVSRTPVHDYYYTDSMVKFFKPNDPVDLAKAIITMCQDKNIREKCAANSKQFIAKHGWKAERERYYQIFDDLLEPQRLQRPPVGASDDTDEAEAG